MDVVAIASRRRRTRNPDMEEACVKHAALTLRLYDLEEGTYEYRSAEARKAWWFDRIRALNPGGAQIVRFPVPTEAKKRGRA